MTSYMTASSRRSRIRRAVSASSLAIAACALTLVACNVSDVLEVDTPDIISPSDVQSAAGADAVRLGAISRLNAATSGGSSNSEGLFMLSGLLADEFINGDSFIDRQQVDQRVIIPSNSFLTDVNRMLQRARMSGEQAVSLLEQYKPGGAPADIAEMYFVQAYVENVIGEHYCNGLVFSDVVNGQEVFGSPINTSDAFERALAHADSGLALITGTSDEDERIANALSVTKGRILVNLGRYADAATAVASVPTDFHYDNLHSQSTRDNQAWAYNIDARRYSVSNNEGGNGLNFATADDPRVPICVGGDAACTAIGVARADRDDGSTPLYVQMIWPSRDAPVKIVDGVEARLIEAEAALHEPNNALFIQKLNQARTEGGVAGLAADLTDPGSDDARVDLLFRERAFWLFGRGHRVGDMRRLIRQYGRPVESVFPTGAWHKGGNYGPIISFPVPQAEQNNPNVAGLSCTNNDA
jgi:hypothetical protein